MEIPDEKLYRTAIIKTGNYAGEHRIYWNREILLKFEPDAKVYKWGEVRDIPAGAWVESMDSTCLQLLNLRHYKNKDGKNYWFYRFPVTTIVAYMLKNGEMRYRNFYGNYMTACFYSQKTRRKKLTSGYDIRKTRFATHIVAGIPLIKAYRLAHEDFRTYSKVSLMKLIKELLMDKIVKEEIRNQVIPFGEKVQETFSDERLLKELDDLIQHSKKGSNAHRENPMFLMNLTGKMPEHMIEGRKKSRDAEEVEYDEVPPPPLGEDGS